MSSSLLLANNFSFTTSSSRTTRSGVSPARAVALVWQPDTAQRQRGSLARRHARTAQNAGSKPLYLSSPLRDALSFAVSASRTSALRCLLLRRRDPRRCPLLRQVLNWPGHLKQRSRSLRLLTVGWGAEAAYACNFTPADGSAGDPSCIGSRQSTDSRWRLRAYGLHRRNVQARRRSHVRRCAEDALVEAHAGG